MARLTISTRPICPIGWGLGPVSFATIGVLALLSSCAPAATQPPSLSSLVVDNYFPDECLLWVGGQPVAEIPGTSRMLVRWLPPMPLSVKWACGQEAGSLRVENEASGLRLGTQTESTPPLVERTSSLRVVNTTATDFSVVLDDLPLGNALAGGESLFQDLATGLHRVTLQAFGTTRQSDMDVQLAGSQIAILRVPACQGTIRLVNDQLRPVEAELRGVKAQLKSGADWTWTEIPAGKHDLAIRSQDSGNDMALQVLVECGEMREVRLNRDSASLILENHFDESVTLALPDREPVEVGAHQTHQLPGLAPGTVKCEVRTASGRLFARELSLTAGGTLTWVLDAPTAELELTNLVGEPLVILRGTTSLTELAPGASAILPVQPGPISWVAWCPPTGYSLPITMDVGKGQRIPVRLGPQGGRIRLENVTDEALWVYRNGHFLGVIPPRIIMEFAGQPLGRNLLEVTTPDGRILARTKIDVGQQQETTQPLPLSREVWDVTLYNDTGESLKLDPTIGGAPLVLLPGIRLLVQVPALDPHVRARGMTSGLGYAARIEAASGASREVHLTSQVGGVLIDNTTAQTVEIWIDGKRIREMDSGGQAALKDLAPGRHLLVGKTKGESAVLLQTVVQLTPGSWFQWVIRAVPASNVVQNRSGENVLVEQNGNVAGRLLQGSQGTLPPSSDPPNLAVQGETSGQVLRIWVPAQKEGTTVQIGTNLGVIAVWGLAGRSCIVELDGLPVASPPAQVAEPLRLTSKPGERRLVMRFDDGTNIERLVRVAPGIESSVRATPDAIALDVRNDTLGTVSLWIAGTRVAELEPGQSSQFSLPTDPAPPKVEAKAKAGNRIWVLHNVALPGSGKFGWVLAE